MKFIPIRGFIRRANLGPLQVDGWAFEIRGYEYVHTWVTPFQGQNRLFDSCVVSQWETGLCISNSYTHRDTKERAADSAARFIRSKGHEKMREILKQVSE